MKAMQLNRVVSIRDNPEPLEFVERPRPAPGRRDVLLKVAACGVCHTELDEIEGRTPPPRFPIIPGHEVVGHVVDVGNGVTRHEVGDRVGVGWIFSSDGSERENLSDQFVATGRDADGGYAEYMTVSEDYAYSIPEAYSDVEAAPLLCAGGIGYRSLRLTGLENGPRLGLTGFGGSGHLVLQLARFLFPDSPVSVFARDEGARQLADQLGAAWTGDTTERAPEPLHAIIDTTPAWLPVVEAMGNLVPGGRLVVNAIRKEDDDLDALLKLDYGRDLWMEREIKSVANITGRDIAEFLPLAEQAGIRPTVTTYPLHEANKALSDLRGGKVRGAKVLLID